MYYQLLALYDQFSKNFWAVLKNFGHFFGCDFITFLSYLLIILIFCSKLQSQDGHKKPFLFQNYNTISPKFFELVLFWPKHQDIWLLYLLFLWLWIFFIILLGKFSKICQLFWLFVYNCFIMMARKINISLFWITITLLLFKFLDLLLSKTP